MARVRVVLAVIDAPGATASTTRVVEAVRTVAREHEPSAGLAHVYTDRHDRGYGVVLYLLAPLDQASAAASRLLFAAADEGAFGPGWTVTELVAWDPAQPAHV